jgi:hypothetical protein
MGRRLFQSQSNPGLGYGETSPKLATDREYASVGGPADAERADDLVGAEANAGSKRQGDVQLCWWRSL